MSQLDILGVLVGASTVLVTSGHSGVVVPGNPGNALPLEEIHDFVGPRRVADQIPQVVSAGHALSAGQIA
jgi:hypothetical protein